MAIDYIIDLNCIPKETLGTVGILERLKEHERADAVIRLFRKNGDDRPPSEMGFEFTRQTPDGTEETQTIIVQDLLDEAAELEPLAHHCQFCPANAANRPFGCMNFIQYPLSMKGETWLLERLPAPDEPLIWLLLKQGIEEFQYDGSSVLPMRQADNTYFEHGGIMSRRLGTEIIVSTDQIFEMLFLLGHIQPSHAGVLLLFFGAIPRDLTAQEIMSLTPPQDPFTKYPFQFRADDSDDPTIAQLKAFFYALYVAWALNVRLILDV